MTRLLPAPLAAPFRWAFTSTPGTPGVGGLSDPKFYLCVACYFGAFLLFATDPFFQTDGVFRYSQGIVTLLIAFLVMASLDWELCLFGKPSGPNLLLHVAQLPAAALFLARIISSPTVPPPPESLLGRALELVKFGLGKFGGDLMSHIPAWLTDLLSNGKVSCFLVLVLFVLCLRSLPIKVAGLALALLVPLGTTLQTGSCSRLLMGMVPFAAGLALQFCRYDRIVYYENIVHILNRSRNQSDSLLVETIGRTMSQLQEHHAISGAAFQGIVKATYLPDARGADLALLEYYTREALQRLIDDGLVLFENNETGARITPNPVLYQVPNNLLAQVAIFPRVLFLVAIGALWILSPIDLIPDSLPLVGVLDDVAVTILSGLSVKSAVEGRPR